MSATDPTRGRTAAVCEAPSLSRHRGSTQPDLLVVLLTVAAALVAAIQLAAEFHWFADLFTHFRVQYVLGGSAVLLLGVLRRQFRCVAVLVVCVGLNAWPLLPYLPTAAAAAPADAGLSILSANVRGSRGDPGRLLELVAAAEPDVLLILEHTPAFDAALAVLHEDYPHYVSAPADGSFGIALYSRMPAPDAQVFRLGPADAVRATIGHEHGKIDFIGVHLLPPTTAEGASTRNAQLKEPTEMLADRSARSVVCGDYNLSPYSPYFRKLLDTTGIRDPRAGSGLSRTWPIGVLPLGIPIDHCLTGSDFEVIRIETLGDIGSDHYPLLIEINPGVTQ